MSIEYFKSRMIDDDFYFDFMHLYDIENKSIEYIKEYFARPEGTDASYEYYITMS